MSNDILIMYAAILSIILTVLFLVVLAFIIRDFNRKFTAYLNTNSDKNKVISNQLSLIHDAIIVLGTIIRPSCVQMLNKYIVSPEHSVLKDMYKCSQIYEDTCRGDECCCSCKFQRILYALSSHDELRAMGIICNVGDVEVLITEHGTCPLYEKKDIL